jgi:TatD DNase family protein
MIYIDLHTHQIKEDANIQILNCFAQDLPFSDSNWYSAGIHPWHIGQVNIQSCLQALDLEIVQKNMLAVGECGLDKSITADFATQKDFFMVQAKIAETHYKPLIIHCVRAYSDLIEIKKLLKPTVPWIIHGFLAKMETTLGLIRHGFYFSIGEKLVTDDQKSKVLKQIPIERLFLETDDSEVSIRMIYKHASKILGIEEELLTKAVQKNFETLFGNDKLPAKN